MYKCFCGVCGDERLKMLYCRKGITKDKTLGLESSEVFSALLLLAGSLVEPRA